MPKHHYLPATYIASFSQSDTFPRRERVVYVGNKKNKSCFKATAANIGYEKNLYMVSPDLFLTGPVSNEYLEKLWSGYETRLAEAIEKLINVDLDADTWARVLVPFVAGILVRSRDFQTRVNRRSFTRELSKRDIKFNI